MRPLIQVGSLGSIIIKERSEFVPRSWGLNQIESLSSDDSVWISSMNCVSKCSYNQFMQNELIMEYNLLNQFNYIESIWLN